MVSALWKQTASTASPAVPCGGAFGVAGKQATQFSLFIDFLKYLGRAIPPCREGGGSAGVAMAMGMWLAPPGPRGSTRGPSVPHGCGWLRGPLGGDRGPWPPGCMPILGEGNAYQVWVLPLHNGFILFCRFFFFFQEEFSAW